MLESLERLYDAWVRTVEHWWDGSWSRLWARHVWLKHDGACWWVEAREGDTDGKVWRMHYDDETAARLMLDGLLARGAAEWRNLTPA